MGRWRSGAPLVLAPDKDDPALGADLQRNNDFNYGKMDPHGYAVPLGSHIRRMNPRDTAANMNRRRMIRRGAHLRPAAAGGRAGRRRGARHRRLRRSARAWSASSSSRRTCGSTTRTSTSSATSATRSSAPRTARSTSRSRSGRSGRRSPACRPSPPCGAAPTSSCPASGRCATCAARRRSRAIRKRNQPWPVLAGAHLQPDPHPAQVHARQAAAQHLLDLELPLGGPARPGRDGQPLLDDDRGAQGAVAGLRDAGDRAPRASSRASPARSSCSTARR